MGGLVIRAALPHLEQFADKMHMYMTLSSPHLGYMYHSSKIIDAGKLVLVIFRLYLRYVGAQKMEKE